MDTPRPERTQRVLLHGLQHLLRGHVGLEAAVALAALTAALTKLGLDGVLAVMRQNPDHMGLPPGRKWRRKGDGAAPLESELRVYAFAQDEAPTAEHLAECRRGVDEAEQGLAAARHAQEVLARSPDGMRARRAALPPGATPRAGGLRTGSGAGRGGSRAVMGTVRRVSFLIPVAPRPAARKRTLQVDLQERPELSV